MKRIPAVLAVLACLLLVGPVSCTVCRHPSPGQPASGAPGRENRPWTREGLEYHPEMAALVSSGDSRELGWSPETGPWREWDSPLLEEFGPGGSAGRRQSPALLLHDFAGALPTAGLLGEDLWQSTVRLLRQSPQKATGVVLCWGLKDDSVAGTDYLVVLESVEGEWSVTEVSERHHCRRGLSPEGLCL